MAWLELAVKSRVCCCTYRLYLSSAACAADVLGVPLGQWLMRNRKPFSMKPLSVAHNIIMFTLSLWMTYETLAQVQHAQLLTAISDAQVSSAESAPHT